MPNWSEILLEIKDGYERSNAVHDNIRRKYLKLLNEKTGRNVIIYYSGWLQKPGLKGVEINDSDKNGFMTVIHKLDRTKGLDLLLHTPGGNVAAVESIVDYLRQMFCDDIRVVVPQIAMSGGTMIACASKEIVMGAYSSLGPIDPQFGNIPAHGVLEEFEKACKDVKADPSKIAIWSHIISKYNPTLLGECEKAMKWSEQLAKDWLNKIMFKGQSGEETVRKVEAIVHELTNHSLSLSHSRHISVTKAIELKLNVKNLSDPANHELQEAVLSVHHATIHTLASTNALKVIENHLGSAFIQSVQPVLVQGTQQ